MRTSCWVLAIGLLMDGAPGVAHAANWTALPNLPLARFGAAAATLNDQVFVLGGRSDTDLANATFWNGPANAWNEATAMPQSRVLGGAASAGGQLLAIGGFGVEGVAVANVDRYDPASGTWSPAAPLPAARAAFGAAAGTGGVVVAGGEDEFGSPVAEVVRYDSGTNTWSSLAALPTPRSGVAVAALDGHTWVIGGLNGSPVATVEVFDPAAGSWSAGPELSEGLWLATAATFAGRVWVIGGFDASFLRSDRVYSAGSDGVWRAEASLPEALAGASASVTGHTLVVAGGLDATGHPSASAYAMVDDTPPPPPPNALEASVTLSPDHLNPTSNGNWITCHIEAVGAWSTSDIVVSSLKLDDVPVAGGGLAVVVAEPTSSGLTVKFSRSAFSSRPPGVYELQLTGHVQDGTPIAGSATLTITGLSKLKKGGGHMTAVRLTGSGAAISFALEADGEVTLDVLDLQGRIVGQVARGFMTAGSYERSWTDANRSAAGLYFLRLRSAESQDVVRLSVYR